MTFKQISSLLDLAKSSDLNAIVYGTEGIGKTSFCKDKFPNSIVILPSELNDSNLAYLKSVFDTKKVIIFENLSNDNLLFLLPILNNRTILGTQITNFFIITARMELAVPNSIPIFFQNPSSVSWLDWAKENGIHTSIIKAIENKDLLESHKPRDLQSLSKILTNNVPKDLLDSILVSFLKNDIESIELIKNDILNSPQTQERVEILHEERTVIPISQEETRNYNNKDEKKLHELRDLLNNEGKQMELNLLLERKEIKEIIDAYLREVI